MNGSRLILAASALLASLVLSGCTQSATSAEREARHYVYAADDGFDPNFRTNKADTARMMVPFFDQFWQAGKKDREAGLSQEDARQRITSFTSNEFLASVRGKSWFAGKAYDNNDTATRKEHKAMVEAITATYMDGYQGRK